MSEGKPEDVIGEIFELPEAEGHAAELVDNTKLSPEQKRALAEKLTINRLLNTSCHVCGIDFEGHDVLEAINLGPIGENDSVCS